MVGAAHVEGMVRLLEAPVDRAALSTLPPPSPWTRILSWVIPLLMLAAFYKGYHDHAGQRLEEMLLAWAIPTGALAGLFTVLAFGHPITIVSAIVAAPITTLHPAIGAGMVTGLIEAWVRKPTVEDCENVASAVNSIRSAYSNRVTRVLLVSVLSSLGAMLGAWVGATWVVSLL